MSRGVVQMWFILTVKLVTSGSNVVHRCGEVVQSGSNVVHTYGEVAKNDSQSRPRKKMAHSGLFIKNERLFYLKTVAPPTDTNLETIEKMK